MYTLLLIAIVMIFITEKSDSQRVKFSLDKDVSTQVKGLAILLVVIGHISIQISDIKFVQNFGNIGVDLFLFVSGYGLTKSYEKNGLSNYIEKRIRTVLIPYSCVTILWVLISYITGRTYSIKTIILAIIGMDLNREIDPTMWYITFILIWYIAYYLIMRFSKNKKNVAMTAIISASIFMALLGKLKLVGAGSPQWVSHSHVFPIGVWYAFYGEKNVLKLKEKILLLCAISCFVLYMVNAQILSGPIALINNIFLIVMILCTLLILCQLNRRSVFLDYIGKYSYEIYLIEGYFIYRINVFELIKNQYIAITIYLIIVFALTLLLHKFMKQIFKLDRLSYNN